MLPQSSAGSLQSQLWKEGLVGRAGWALQSVMHCKSRDALKCWSGLGSN